MFVFISRPRAAVLHGHDGLVLMQTWTSRTIVCGRFVGLVGCKNPICPMSL